MKETYRTERGRVLVNSDDLIMPITNMPRNTTKIDCRGVCVRNKPIVCVACGEEIQGYNGHYWDKFLKGGNVKVVHEDCLSKSNKEVKK